MPVHVNYQPGDHNSPPYESIEIVNRQDQLKEFNKILGQIRRRGAIPVALLEWYGSPGIGKSVLIKLLLRECHEQNIPNILIDFKASADQKGDFLGDPTILVENMAQQLADSGLINVHSLTEKIQEYRDSQPPHQATTTYFQLSRDEQLYPLPSWIANLRSVVIEFLKIVVNLAQHEPDHVTPVVALFDETEYADIELANWIEEWILNPLLQTKNCVVVWAARRPWRWKKPEIRRRLRSEELKAFGDQEIKWQMESNIKRGNLAEGLFKNVRTVTQGHPFANAIVISQLNDWQAEGLSITPQDLTDREPEIRREIFEKFVLPIAFRDLDSDLKTACQLLAMVRLFDTTMVRDVLVECADKKFTSWTQEDFGELMRQLKKTQLLIWEKGYTLDPLLRHLIRGYFFTCDLSHYVQVNRTALEVYRRWLSKKVDNRNLFFIELLYHQACLSGAGEQIDFKRALAEQLQQYRLQIEDDQVLSNALERLKEEIDHDPDLVELEQLAGIFSVRLVIDQIQEFANSTLVN